MNQRYLEIRPPNKFVLRWLERLAVPLAGLVSIATAILTLWLTPVKEFVLGWAMGSLILLVTIMIYRTNPNIFSKSILRIFSEESVGVYVWVWVTILFLITSFHADIIKVVALYPQYILPFALFINRTPRNRSLTPSVLIITLFTAAVLGYGSWKSISENLIFVEQQNTFFKLDNIYSIGSLIIWGVFGPLIIYYFVRRSQLSQIRFQAVQEAMLRLLEIDDPLISAEEVVKILSDKVGVGDRVLLLNYDQNTDTIKVIASTGIDAIKASGYELPKGRGVSRRAINTLKTQYVPNVIKDADYISGGLPEKGSEVSAPIIVSHDNMSRAIGTINVQENAINAFTDDDVRIIEIFAEIIANFDYGYSEKFEQSMDIELEKINRFDDPDKLVYHVINALGSLFDNSLICYYRLAIGTGFPLHPCYLNGDFTDPEFFVNPNLLDKKSNLMEWLYDWDAIFIRHMKSDVGLLDNGYGFGSDFQKRESFVSMCFLPIGNRNYRIGALLLFFKNQRMFSKSEITNMRGFVREIWPHVARTEFVNSILGGFAQPQLHFHSTLAETGLGRGTWESILGQVESSGQISSDLEDKVKQLHTGIKMFLDRLRAWEVTQVFQLGVYESFSIKGALNRACADLQQRFGGLVVREIDNSLEAETNDLKQVIYILVTEAIRNAFIHGRTATRIHLKINHSNDQIVIMVSDDGVGFDPKKILSEYCNDPTYTSRGSIFDLDILGQQLLGAAPIDWLDTAPGNGTRLVWKIPLLGKSNLEQ